MRLTVLILAMIAVAALAACERKAKPVAPDPDVPAEEAREVAAADAYADAGEAVNAVAFWSHPSINFEGLLLATSGPAIAAYSIETGEQRASAMIDGPAGGVAVFYAGVGPQAQGYAVVTNALGYSFFSIGGQPGSLTPAANIGGATARFCVGRRGAGNVLYQLRDDMVEERAITFGADGGVLLADAAALAKIEGVAFCAVDDRSGAIITVSEDGAIRRIDPASGESFGLAIATGVKPAGAALFLMRTAEPANAPGGAVALLDGASGAIRFYDLEDGHALGSVRIKSTFDLTAVESATAIAAGSGNYGGVYRDGALAVVTAGPGAPIRLVPWNGVLAALQLPLGENVDPRDPSPAAEEKNLINIEFVEP